MVTDQTHSASHASEQRYRHLFENLPICIFVVDLTATPAAKDIARYRVVTIY